MKGIASYLIKRGLDRLILIFAVLTVQFILIRVIPAYWLGIDPSRYFIEPGSPPHVVEAVRRRFGFDQPIFPNQYATYVLALFEGQFGQSFVSRRPVYGEIMERLPNTVILSGLSLIVITIIGMALGLYAASKRGRFTDSFISYSSIFSYIMPTWLMGIILLMALAWYPQITLGVKLFPISGTQTPLLPPDALIRIGDYAWHLALPLLSNVIAGFGSFAYYMRNIAITELGQDYVTTARAKGLSEGTIMRRHVTRSAAPPVVTVVALSLPGVFSGGIITETIFSWYGLGLYFYQALTGLDYPAVQALLFIIAIVTAISLYLTDVVIAYLDPRVRLK